MAAKPRVHEIASELGVDQKVALAVLREMGEFVKGPSSSIEPPVARKLRARLLALDLAPHDRLEMGRRRAAGTALALRLPRSLPEFADLLGDAAIGPLPSRQLLREAAASGNFYFVPEAGAVGFGQDARVRRDISFDEIPSPVGLAVISGPVGRQAPRTLLWWVATEGRLNAAQASFDLPIVGGARDPHPAIRFSETEHGQVDAVAGRFPTSAAPAARTLAALVDAIPTVPDGSGAAPSVRKPTGPSGTTQDDQPQIVYLQRRRTESGHKSAGAAVHRQSQWSVRGHWRNQWYASQNDHHRIWIDEHTAGATDAPAVTRRKVFVIRPRVDS